MKVLSATETAMVSGGDFLSLSEISGYVVSPYGSGDVLQAYENIVAWLQSFTASC